MNAEIRGAANRDALLPILQRRLNTIVEMLQNEPGNVRGVMLDAAEAQRIVAIAPEAAGLLESEGMWDGELETAVQDDFSTGANETRFYFRMGAQKVRVLNDPGFPEAANKFCPQPLRLRGLRAGDVMEAASVEEVLPEPATSCSPIGNQQTAVFLVNYPSRSLTSYWNSSTANSLVFGASNSIASYVAEVSHNKATLTGNVFGPYTVDTNFTCFEDPGNIADAVIRVIRNSINLRAYQRAVFIVPTASDCANGSRGISSVGCWTITLFDGGTTQLSVSQASASPGQEPARLVFTHEYGHALGVSHAGSLEYSGAALGNLTDGGTKDEYGDLLSVMGIAQIAHLGAPHQDLLEWFDPGGVTTVSTVGTYQLRPLESAASDVPKALKVQRPGTTRNLWIEYRQPIGIDSVITSRVPTAFQGVVVHYQDPPGVTSSQRKTHLVDYHPTTSGDFSDAPLLAGETWTDPYSTLRLTIGSATSSGINVTVNFASSCTYSLGPGSGITVPSSSTGGTINVTTQAGCPWSASSNSAWLTITSGSSGTGSGATQFQAAANTGGQRSGIITIAGQAYTVTQSAFFPTCTYSLGPGSSTNVPAALTDGSISMTTQSGCGWTAGSNAGWLTITGGASGTDSGTIFFSAALNTGTARSGVISAGGQNYTVNQGAGTCTYSLSPGNSNSIVAAGGTGTISVTAPSQCGWSANSNSGWLIVTSGGSGTGPGLVQYTVQANTDPQRVGVITIASEIYTITQASGATSATPDNALTLSHIVGGGGWQTTIFLANVSGSSESFTLRFYDDNGSLKAMPIDGIGLVDALVGTIAPGETRRYETGFAPNDVIAWALLTPGTAGANRLSGSAVFRLTVPASGGGTVSSEGVVDLTKTTESKYILLYDNVGFDTSAAFVNPDPVSPLSILADIRDENGVLIATDVIGLPALGHTAFELRTRFPSTVGRRGSIRFSASPRGWTGFGLRFSPFNTFTSFRFLTTPDIQ